MATQRYKRKRFLLNEFQYRLLAFNLLYFFTILIVTAGVLFVPLMIKLESSALSPAEQQEVADLVLSLHALLWPAIGVVFVLLAIHSVVVSHRIAGALYRFHTVFKAVAQGDLTARATLRKKDYLTKEAADFNGMLEALGATMAGASERCAGLQRALAELRQALEGGSREAADRAVGKAGEEVERLKAGLERFKTR